MKHLKLFEEYSQEEIELLAYQKKLEDEWQEDDERKKKKKKKEKTNELVGFGGGGDESHKPRKGIFKKLKDYFSSERKGDGLYFWTDEEINKLESLHFKREDSTSDTATFTYIPSDPDEDLEIITVRKMAEVDYNRHQEDWFYKLHATFVDEGKGLNSDFDTFGQLIDYVNTLIKQYDPLHKTTTKYNL